MTLAATADPAVADGVAQDGADAIGLKTRLAARCSVLTVLVAAGSTSSVFGGT
jgi:hypothetical protein